jgi:hypothetical protein
MKKKMRMMMMFICGNTCFSRRTFDVENDDEEIAKEKKDECE